MITQQDLLVVGFLVFLEGILSIDNALALAVLAKPLPKDERKKALLYGLVGAFVFRIVAIGLAAYLIQWRWVKFVGGAYLIFIAIKDLFFKKAEVEELAQATTRKKFWQTVIVIELTDIAFAVDSILAAVAMTPKIPLIITGGIIGLVLMRFAASAFITLLEKFPTFEKAAFVLVFIIGVKVVIEGLSLPGVNFHDSGSPAFWIFWTLMFGGFFSGFIPSRKHKHPGHEELARIQKS